MQQRIGTPQQCIALVWPNCTQVAHTLVIKVWGNFTRIIGVVLNNPSYIERHMRTLRHGNRFGLHRRRLQHLDELFERHGGKTVIFSRFIAFVRALAPFVAGSSRMPYLRFLAFNAVGAVLWAVALVSLGYLLGASWRIAEQWVGRVGAVAGVIVITLAIIWFRWRRAASRAP